MPTYEYECTSCGQHIEVFQRISEEPLTTCGVCGGALRKVFHPAGIVFKGSGFYATDSRSSSMRSAKKKPGDSGSSDSSSSTSGESSSSGGGSTSASGESTSSGGGSTSASAKGSSAS
jgi:putative FmdB family regulatory protein